MQQKSAGCFACSTKAACTFYNRFRLAWRAIFVHHVVVRRCNHHRGTAHVTQFKRLTGQSVAAGIFERDVHIVGTALVIFHDAGRAVYSCSCRYRDTCAVKAVAYIQTTFLALVVYRNGFGYAVCINGCCLYRSGETQRQSNGCQYRYGFFHFKLLKRVVK